MNNQYRSESFELNEIKNEFQSIKLKVADNDSKFSNLSSVKKND
jgi:hypothetical protein